LDLASFWGSSPGGAGSSQNRIQKEKLISTVNAFVMKYIRIIELVGVLMRIFSFSLVSWLGPASPFRFVWTCNTLDAILLSWCAILKKDSAYTLLNVFWVMVGVVGMLRAGDVIH